MHDWPAIGKSCFQQTNSPCIPWSRHVRGLSATTPDKFHCLMIKKETARCGYDWATCDYVLLISLPRTVEHYLKQVTHDIKLIKNEYLFQSLTSPVSVYYPRNALLSVLSPKIAIAGSRWHKQWCIANIKNYRKLEKNTQRPWRMRLNFLEFYF